MLVLGEPSKYVKILNWFIACYSSKCYILSNALPTVLWSELATAGGWEQIMCQNMYWEYNLCLSDTWYFELQNTLK